MDFCNRIKATKSLVTCTLSAVDKSIESTKSLDVALSAQREICQKQSLFLSDTADILESGDVMGPPSKKKKLDLLKHDSSIIYPHINIGELHAQWKFMQAALSTIKEVGIFFSFKQF